MKQSIKIPIGQIAEEIEGTNNLTMFWDYQDCLTEEQALKIITEQEGLNEVENEIYDFNLEYIYGQVNNAINEYENDNNIILEDEDRQELARELQGRFNFNMEGLIKNSGINVRLELLSNEDMINLDDYKTSETLKEFKRVFKGKVKVKDLKEEINEMIGSNYALITFFFKVRGLKILEMREQVIKGHLTLKKGLRFGLFNSYSGCGAMLDIPLLKNITLNLNDWRNKNNQEAVIKGLKGEGKSYYELGIKADNLSKYGIQETYGLVGEAWKEW